MAATSSPINLGVVGTPRRSYVSTGPFHLDIFRYTTAMNASYQTVGTLTSLSVVGTGNSSNCPANRVLRENGRRLVPDATPCTPAITTLLVGVYDAISGLSGFIDPNSPKFAVYGTDRANWLADATNPVGGAKDTPRATTVLAIPTLAANAGASGNTAALNAAAAQTFTLTTANNTTTATTYVLTVASTDLPPVGGMVNIIITCVASTAATTITFQSITGSVFRESANLVCSNNVGDIQVISFISNGTSLIEMTRSATDPAAGVGAA